MYITIQYVRLALVVPAGLEFGRKDGEEGGAWEENDEPMPADTGLNHSVTCAIGRDQIN